MTTLLQDQWLLNHQGSVLAPYGLPPMASLGRSYSSAEVQLVYSTAPADQAAALQEPYHQIV